jgi:hypothetical protein
MKFKFASESSDLADVVDAAEALGISEYDFFRLAYRRWFCQEPEEEELEETYVSYMFHQTIPHWVRHFTRDVKAQAESGELDAAKLGALDYRRRLPPQRHGGLLIGLMGALTVLYCVALTGTTYFDPQSLAPMPCNGGPGFKVLSSMAYAVSGKDVPACEDLRSPR